MALRYKRFLVLNTQSVVDVYWATTVDDLITPPRATAIAYVGPGGSEIPYVYQAGAWHTTVGDAIGPAGAQGVPGADGAPGAAGAQGIQGVSGVQGVPGVQGEQGPQGEQGEEGRRGPIGFTGPKGDQGDQGVQGFTGLRGVQGDRGAGVPTGGTVGQVLTKNSSLDDDTYWSSTAGGGGIWGSIVGDIADQTDLQDALAAKMNTGDSIPESQVTGLLADLASLSSAISARALASRQIISGAGLTGGGDLSADRTLAVGAGTGITVAADAVAADFGTGAGKVTEGNDSRLSDARTPTAHATSHKSAGSDPIRIDELKIGTDVTTLNATATEHGLLAKLSGANTDFLDGSGAFDTVKDSDLALTDITTNDASTTKHGFAPKAVAPASGLLSALAIGNGETAFSNKPLFDTTNPAALGTVGPGTQVIAARRDHVHANPAIDTLAAATDITTLNSSTTAHGLLKKLSNVATEFMNGQGNWATPSFSGVLFISKDITEAQFEASSTTPVTLVAAQGANTVIVPIYWSPEIKIATAYANNPTFSLAYAANPTLNIGPIYSMSINGAAPAQKMFVGWQNNPTDRIFTFATNDPRNDALVMRSNADPSAGGSATMRVHLAYFVVTTQ